MTEVLSVDSTRRLAQYRPFERGGDTLRDVICDLVVTAAGLGSGSFESLAEARDAIHTLWGLEVEIDELREVVERLDSEGLVTHVGGGYALAETTRDAFEERTSESRAIEEEAFAEWEADLRRIRPDLSAADLEQLRADFSEWLQKVIARHGAEAALVLYPEEKQAVKLLEQIEAAGYMSDRGDGLGQLRDEGFRRFVRQPTVAQRRFLANLLNTAFYLTVLTLDPAARNLTQESAQGRRIYLDTNFLYAVLGVAATAEVASAHRLLELSAEIGIELAVTPWTVAELHKSIDRARQEVGGLPLNSGVAHLMVRVTGEKGYAHDFWEKYAELGARPSDYFDRVSHFELDLPKLGISVVDEGCTAVDQKHEAVGDYAALLDRILVKPRHHEVVDHDVKHRLLVERLRGEGRLTFSNARYWFLTQDSKLTRFARYMPEVGQKAPDLPFCISPSSWLQIIRALTPRTDDYEQTVVDLLTSPFVGYAPAVDQRAVREVVGRMELQDDGNPELALAVLEDSALVRRIVDARSEDDVKAEVDRAYSTKTRELQEQTHAANERAESAEDERQQIARDLTTEIGRREALESDLHAAQRRMTEAQAVNESQLQEQQARFQSAIDEQASKTEALRAELERQRTEEKAKADRRSHRLWKAVAVGFLVLAVVAAVLAVRSRDDLSQVALASVLAGAVCIVVWGVRTLLGETWGGRMFRVADFWIGAFGLTFAVVLWAAQK